MENSGAGNPSLKMRLKPFPVPSRAGFLAPAPDCPQPEASDGVTELVQALIVPRDGVIAEPSLHDAGEPGTGHVKWLVHPLAEFLLDRLERGPHAFGDTDAEELEGPSASLSTAVSETQKIKRFRFSTTPALAVAGCVAAKLDQPRLVRVQSEAELLHAFRQVLAEPFGIVPVLEAHDESSSPGESHPQALTEPDVSLSAHPALIVQSQVGFHVTIT